MPRTSRVTAALESSQSVNLSIGCIAEDHATDPTASAAGLDPSFSESTSFSESS
jgi:hypothetical protein